MKDNNFWAHFHLTVNEVSVIGFLLAIIFLIMALATKRSDGWGGAGMLTLMISIVGIFLAFSAETRLLMRSAGCHDHLLGA